MTVPRSRLRRAGALAALAAALCGCGDAASELPATGALATAPAAAGTVPAVPPPIHGCRLPLSGRAAGGGEAAGFLRLALGTAAADPAGDLLPGSGGDPRARTAVAPVLRGAPGTAPGYDRAAGRWVPAPPAAIAQDGSAYAYAAGDGVHLVDVRAAADRVLDPGAGLEVLGWQPEGVYLVQRPRAGGPSDGLWLLDPASGQARELRAPEAGVEWTGAGGGAAWASAVRSGGVEEVWRLDPATLGVTTWLHRQGAGLLLVAVDGDGRPLVQVAAPQASSIWLVSEPGVASQVSDSAPGGDDTPVYPAAVTDPSGTWVSDDGGNLYRFTPATGLRRVDAPRLFAATQRVAGGCS